ncbi:hypothetical protein J1N35_038470 [Gossypium stocksii]|uniref:DUF4283 domain-containing protein n=1 Tax=Gossypium stocksii TaxID=47602 RepID=A0A9D3ZLW5_9ROSI|nr:hypothetical protein J1N35_038470 [Gossypium stocksii]
MASIDLVDTELASLNLLDEEEDPLLVLDENNVGEQLYDLCLVGRVLTESVVNFPSLKNTLVDLWHLLRGVSITELANKRILFRFYSEVDLKRVLDGLPWFFNRHLIVFHKLEGGEDPDSVPLWHTVFWVQVHNLPVGVTSEGTARQLGDFVGKFMEYDTSIVTRGGSNFIRIRVMLDVRLPLKRKKRISMGQNKLIYALFQYERLPLFCFIYGRLGHGESYCDVRLTLRDQQVAFGWDLSLRAMPRRRGQVASKWLREESRMGKWNDMEMDGDQKLKSYGMEVTNKIMSYGEAGSLCHVTRQIRNVNTRHYDSLR